jgi:hypothetical protein
LVIVELENEIGLFGGSSLASQDKGLILGHDDHQFSKEESPYG